MAELKTKPNTGSVQEFLEDVPDAKRRGDATRVLELMRDVTGQEPVMWGDSIVGFGLYHYKYASGHEGETCIVGFSPRKQALTLYFSSGLQMHEELLTRLGKHTTGKGCLYVKDLDRIDLGVLREMLEQSAHALGGSPA